MESTAVTRKQWADALRSGKYKQGRNWLRKNDDGNDKFCCLGVLCDLIDPNGWSNGLSSVYEYHNHNQTPPKFILDELGITEKDVNLLIHMNDNARQPFNVIADAIEGYVLEGYGF